MATTKRVKRMIENRILMQIKAKDGHIFRGGQTNLKRHLILVSCELLLLSW